jgi:REP element-mobilizing transposase RayT
MPRVLRSVLGDGLFHVWTVAVDGDPAFEDDLDRISFVRLLGESVHGYEWEMYAWCLLTTHYHLVIAGKQERISAGMQRLNGLHAQRANRRRERKGHLFGSRFASRIVEGENNARPYVATSSSTRSAQEWWSGRRTGSGAGAGTARSSERTLVRSSTHG